MSEKSKKVDQSELLKQQKAAHDYIATAVQILTTRVQYYAEEFEGTHQTIQFLRNMLAQIKADIEKIEPPKPQDQSKPYSMDLTHVKGESQETVAQ